MTMRAVTVDGTGIEVDRLRLGTRGVKLQRTGGPPSERDAATEDEQVTVVFDDDVPAEDRRDLLEEVETRDREDAAARDADERSEGESPASEQRSSQEAGGQSSSQRSSKRPETIGFVPYERLLYVRPDVRIKQA